MKHVGSVSNIYVSTLYLFMSRQISYQPSIWRNTRFRLWDIILKYGQSVFGTHIEMEAWLWLWLAGWLVSGGFVRFFPLIKNISVVCGKPFSFVSSQTIAYCGCLEMYLYRAAIYFVVFCRWPTIYMCVCVSVDWQQKSNMDSGQLVSISSIFRMITQLWAYVIYWLSKWDQFIIRFQHKWPCNIAFHFVDINVSNKLHRLLQYV